MFLVVFLVVALIVCLELFKTNTMADGLHEQHDQQKTDDESAADHHPATQIQDPEILNPSKTKISESTKPTESSDGEFSERLIRKKAEEFPLEDHLEVGAERSSYKPPVPVYQAYIAPSYLENSEEPTNTADHGPTVRKRNIIIVTPESLQSNSRKYEEERFPEEEAVCKICFGKFETQNMFMTKCKCPKAVLIHEECKSANNCKVCKQAVTSFAVNWRLESIKEFDIRGEARCNGEENSCFIM